jgi:hypothetical protein
VLPEPAPSSVDALRPVAPVVLPLPKRQTHQPLRRLRRLRLLLLRLLLLLLMMRQAQVQVM